NGGTGGTGGNVCYGGAPCTAGSTPKEKVSWYTFEYFSYGGWKVGDLTSGSHSTTLFDTDTAAAGALLQITRTGTETYDLSVNTVGPAGGCTTSGTFSHPGALTVVWGEW